VKRLFKGEAYRPTGYGIKLIQNAFVPPFNQQFIKKLVTIQSP
jgi:hypothetical protein